MARQTLTDEERKARNRERTARLFARYKHTGTDERGNPDAWKANAAQRLGQPTDADDWATLGLSRPTDAAGLKAAYRERMRTIHPDVGGDHAEAARVNAAYERLSKPPETSGCVYTTPAPAGNRRDTRLRAQLLNAIEEFEALPLLADDRWCLQEKMDGKHVIVRVADGGVTAANKQGLETAIPAQVELDLARLSNGQPMVIDGELIGGEFWAFDLLECDGQDLRSFSYGDRYAVLERTLPGFSFGCVRRVRTHVGKAKAAEFARLKAAGAEGVVFKRIDARWAEGRPHSGGDMLKHKFVATLSAIVSEEKTGKNSFHSFVWDEAGRKVPLGRCTVPGGRPVPPVDSIVEIRYLYFVESLVQPCFLGIRDDVSPGECTARQIKYKAKPTP